MSETIYMPLEDEGVDVWRPAPAYRLPDGKYIVLRPANYDPDVETWTFPPGSIVECKPLRRGDAEFLAAVGRVRENDVITEKQAG